MKQIKIFLQTIMTIFLVGSLTTARAQCNLGVSVTATESRCKATGTISVTVTNGSGNYNYLVTGSSYTSNTSSNLIDGLAPGTYSVKVTDLASGCTVDATNIVIAGGYQDPRFYLSATDVTCMNATNGTISVNNLQYGTAPFIFTIVSPSASNIGVSNATGYFDNLAAGDYYVQLQDSCGGIQTRVISIAAYSWNPSISASFKPACDTVDVTVGVSDNRGNNNSSGAMFSAFQYGVTMTPGDTTWTSARNFRFYKGNKRSATIVVKDPCGNLKPVTYIDASIPNVSGSVTVSNYQCSGVTATITGQQYLSNPQYCLYTSGNTLVGCNTTGVFTSVPYGSYYINIQDACYDTTFTRFFSAVQPTPSVSGTVAISNLDCKGFTATITGQANLNSPQYCLYDSVGALISCNTTGVFNTVRYGRYCINITDGCTGAVITRCFTQRQALPNISSGFGYSNLQCSTFTLTVTGQQNLTNPQYCIYDYRDTVIACNTTGVFNNMPYGSYCVHVKNDSTCFDTTLVKCFTVFPPTPSVGNTVGISNNNCTTFTASINGQTNLNSPTYYLLDATSTIIDSNTTGVFNNLAHGSYCIRVKNSSTCYDTTMTRCFSVLVPVPSISNAVNITNRACFTYSAAVTGQANLTSPKYYLVDGSNSRIDSNTTGSFNNIPYGAYCIQVVNTCYDTTMTVCFSASPTPISVSVNASPSCSNLGKTDLAVTVASGVVPYTIKVYNPAGSVVNTTVTSLSSITIYSLANLPSGLKYKIIVKGTCAGSDSAFVTPNAYTINKSINANSKCPGGLWQNGSGDLLVFSQFSGGSMVPTIISKDGSPVSIAYSYNSGSNYTFTNMAPATYIIKYALQGCGTPVYDTFNLKSYNFPSLNKSAVYQCNNSSFSVNAAVTGGIGPFAYEVIGSNPSIPSIASTPQATPTFNINNGSSYSLVRLRVIDACGNATINDASILPLANTVISASSDCYYNDIQLTVDTIPNATYTWFKKTSPIDSVLIDNNQTHVIPYLLPTDTGVYVNVMSLNAGCLTRVAYFDVTGSCGGLLASNALTFTATPNNGSVQLKWNTNSGFDASSFIVERSADGSRFTAIGTVAAMPSSATDASQYYFTDINALDGKSFYRLRMVKANDNTAYSSTLTVNMKARLSLSVMPNPVAESFNVKFDAMPAGTYNLSVVGTDGKTVITNRYTIRTGEVKTILRPAQATTGVYFLIVVNQSTQEKNVIKLFFK